MSLEYIFPDHTQRNRRIAIIVECIAAAAALSLMFWAMYHFWGGTDTVVPVQTISDQEKYLIDKRAAIEAPNPQIVLTPDQAKEKQAALSQKNPVTNLTPEEISEKKSILENI